MSSYRTDRDDGIQGDASRLLARAAAADTRAEARLAVAIDDFFLPDDWRLDDRIRSALAITLTGLVAVIESALRQHVARLLSARAHAALAAAIASGGSSILERLVAAGLVRDAELMRELLARVRQTLLAEALPSSAPDYAETPSLLVRLAHHADGIVAAGAIALLSAESRRRASAEGEATTQADLPASQHQRLVWWVAAALRDRFSPDAGDSLAALDDALAEAALRSLAAHDEGDRLESVAMRLAAAYDARPRELPLLLVEALGDRRIGLFTALIAHAMRLDYGQTRDIVTDPAGDQLWLVLRALELDRESIARIGLALCEADPRRDIDQFADTLDGIAATSAETARAALAPLNLHPDYRAALLALARGRVA